MLFHVQQRAKRGPYAKTAARRAEILGVALEVFAHSGYRSASVREIAERVGLSEMGVLHHFGGKTQMLQAVLDARDQADQAAYGPTEELNRERLEELVANNQRRPGVVRMFAALSGEAIDPEHPAHDWYLNRAKWVRQSITDAMATEGAVAIAPEMAARLVAAMMVGLRDQWLLEPELEMVPAFQAFLSLLYGDAHPAAGSVSTSSAADADRSAVTPDTPARRSTNASNQRSSKRRADQLRRPRVG